MVRKVTVTKTLNREKTRNRSGWANGGGATCFSFFRFSCKQHFWLNFSNVDVYINNQQIYNFNGLYAHNACLFNNFKEVISEYMRVLHCEGYIYGKSSHEILESPLCEHFITRRINMRSRSDGFKFYGELGVDIMSTSELLDPILKFRSRVIRARLNFYMISDNLNVGQGIVDCFLDSPYCTQGWLSEEMNEHGSLYSCGVQLFRDSSKDFYFSC